MTFVVTLFLESDNKILFLKHEPVSETWRMCSVVIYWVLVLD